VAGRSLRRLPGFEDLHYDYVSSEAQRTEIQEQVLHEYSGRSLMRQSHHSPQRLLTPEGDMQEDRVQKLLEQRDDQPVRIKE
jgi:hypothetical protein